MINFVLAGGMDELKMRRTGSVAGKGMKRNEYGVLVGKLQGMRPFVRLGTGGSIILK
jgi:hypothetical protein